MRPPLCCFALAAFLAIPSLAAAQFTIVDLGTLGGASSEAHGVNLRGDVVGVAKDAGGRDRAFVWTSGGGIAALTDLGGPSSIAYAINGDGLAVGAAADTTSGAPLVAVRWAGGPAVRLGSFGGLTSVALAVNDREEIVGSGDTNPTFGNPHGFLWRGGVITDLQTLGGLFSVAFGINDASVIVGASLPSSGENHACRWAGTGPWQDLGVLAAGTRSAARAINTAGAIVGLSNVTSGGANDHAFFRAAGSSTLNDLGTLGGASSEAYDVNDAGTLVGWAQDGTGARRAFTSTGAGMTDLNTVLPGGSGWVLNEARAINDAGQIVGVGVHNGQTRAFLLSPPAPLLGVAAGSGVHFAGAQPNPVREHARFAWTLPTEARVTLAIHDVSGRRVRTLAAGTFAAGAAGAEWDGRDAAGARVAPGVYLARLEVAGAAAGVRRVSVVR